MKKAIGIFFGILVGGGLLVFILDKGFSCYQAYKKDQIAQAKLFYSPNSVKWQIAYQTCSNIIVEAHCPLSLEIDSSEKENLTDKSLKASFEDVLSRFKIFDKECALIKDQNRLKEILVSVTNRL
jgi:hypothetical protein